MEVSTGLCQLPQILLFVSQPKTLYSTARGYLCEHYQASCPHECIPLSAPLSSIKFSRESDTCEKAVHQQMKKQFVVPFMRKQNATPSLKKNHQKGNDKVQINLP